MNATSTYKQLSKVKSLNESNSNSSNNNLRSSLSTINSRERKNQFITHLIQNK